MTAAGESGAKHLLLLYSNVGDDSKYQQRINAEEITDKLNPICAPLVSNRSHWTETTSRDFG